MNVLSISIDLPILDISYKWKNTIYDLFYLASFISIMFSRFTNIAECVRTSFFLLINIPFFPCILLKIYLIPSSTHGHWVFPLFWAIMNNAAMSIYTQASVWIYVFISFEYTPRSGNSGLLPSCLTSWETAELFSKQLCHVTFLPAVYEGPSFSISSPTLLTVFFYYSHSIKCEVVSLVVFICILLDIFSCAYCSFMCLLWRNSCSNPLLIF